MFKLPQIFPFIVQESMHLNLSQYIDEVNNKHHEFKYDVMEDIEGLQNFTKRLGITVIQLVYFSYSIL